MSNIYEWLADRGTIQKVPSPLRLTPKSQITVDEAAYYYDGTCENSFRPSERTTQRTSTRSRA
ncbi:MAG: hypothetical protein M3Q45_15290 [Chloroflexota bacterium]|nr:hypothetical protein [Chloroflexota bacterium]